MRYHYIALSQDSRELGGVIEARDEAEARKKLNELSMSVISLTSVEEGTSLVADGKTLESEVPLFEFEAFDKNNKKVVGTIASADDVHAFKRLFEEYKLSVYYLADTHLDAQSKKQAREKGIVAIQAKYSEIKNQEAQTPVSQTTNNNQLSAQSSTAVASTESQANAQKEKEELLEIVTKTLGKINAFITQYGTQIKQEERDIILSYNNQLMRIKDSSNLDHIRTTCEKMLSHIQKQELFINEQEKIKESAQLKLETSKLLDELNMGNLSKSIYIGDVIAKWKALPLLKSFAELFERVFPPLTPEMRAKKEEIAALSLHLRTYYKTLFVGSTKALKAEAWIAIKNLYAQKKRLNLEYQALRSEQKRIIEAQNTVHVLNETNAGSLVGFLFAFYLVAYFATYLFTVKKTPFNLPVNSFFYQTKYIKALTLALFFMYSRKAFFKLHDRYNGATARFISATGLVIGYIIISVNLL